MEFGGFVKNSFVDFPGVISSVVFTAGCNFNCWYCHNQGLINGEIKGHIHETEVLDFLISRKGFIDGLVISGGEPTLHLGLKAFIQKVKDLGLLIKLDTNGTNPKLLEELLEENLVDFVAMDIKT
ncbi:MAG: anaerobic ribonucleoside-triphosphate reductase activating protein, partial [Clostridia bacterium]